MQHPHLFLHLYEIHFNNISGAGSFIVGIGVRPNLLDFHLQSSAFLELLNHN
jgi:hypothetical protein